MRAWQQWLPSSPVSAASPWTSSSIPTGSRAWSVRSIPALSASSLSTGTGAERTQPTATRPQLGSALRPGIRISPMSCALATPQPAASGRRSRDDGGPGFGLVLLYGGSSLNGHRRLGFLVRGLHVGQRTSALARDRPCL